MLPFAAMSPLVSIIINVHNNARFLPAAIESALAQTYSPIELLVYDNASEEDLRSIVARYPKARYFRSEEFLPLGTARNRVLEMAQGELISFLDSDDLYLPRKTACQVPLFEDPSVAVAFANGVEFHEGEGALTESPIYRRRPPEGAVYPRLLGNNFISWVTTMFRRSAVEAVSGRRWFDESFEICTDYDLYLRVLRQHRLRYADEILCKYRWHGTNTSQVKMHLTVRELHVILGRLIEGEPELFVRYPRELARYLAMIAEHQIVIHWRRRETRPALAWAWRACLLSPRLANLAKIPLLPVVSDYDSLMRLWGRLRRWRAAFPR